MEAPEKLLRLVSKGANYHGSHACGRTEIRRNHDCGGEIGSPTFKGFTMSISWLSSRLCAVSLIAALTPATVYAQSAKIGSLVCHISGGVGMILMENQALDCVYQDASGAPPTHYIGRLTNVGVNIGISGPGQLVWGVVAATNSIAPGALAGDYVGAQGNVAVGAGAGGAVLVGGSNKTISLQPISVSAETGLNLSAGIGNLSLQYMPVTPPPPQAASPAPQGKRKRGH